MKDKILDKHYKSGMHWKSVNRQNVLDAMEVYATRKIKQEASSKPYLEADLQGCELCERYADIELMQSNGDDGYLCKICIDAIEKK